MYKGTKVKEERGDPPNVGEKYGTLSNKEGIRRVMLLCD